MKQENVFLRSLQSIRSFLEPSFISKSDIKHDSKLDVKHNVILAKWDEHYNMNPNEFIYRSQRSTLNYITPAD